MPIFRPPRKGVAYSTALAAAYASAPEDEIILDTVEFLHPLFLDADGQPLRIRVVNDHEDLIATLEYGAPLDSSQTVTFKAAKFRFQRPSESESGELPEIEIQMDNVSHYLMPYLNKAKESYDKVTVIWRPYCVSDLSGPHMNPPVSLTVRNATANSQTVSLRAGFGDLGNRRFPALEYTPRNFPGLIQR